MQFRIYAMTFTVNGTKFNEVWIDPHYEESHKGTVTDELILQLIKLLESGKFEPETEREDGYKFFVNDLRLNQKLYRLVWVTPPGESYLGVRTAYRRSE
jgi:hypothetical protein